MECFRRNWELFEEVKGDRDKKAERNVAIESRFEMKWWLWVSGDLRNFMKSGWRSFIFILSLNFKSPSTNLSTLYATSLRRNTFGLAINESLLPSHRGQKQEFRDSTAWQIMLVGNKILILQPTSSLYLVSALWVLLSAHFIFRRSNWSRLSAFTQRKVKGGNCQIVRETCWSLFIIYEAGKSLTSRVKQSASHKSS